MQPPRPVSRSTSIAVAASLAFLAGSGGFGCSKGGAPDGYGVAPGDMRGGLPDGRSSFDLSRPAPRTQVDFAAAVTYPADSGAMQITTGRFNNDSYPDLLASGYNQVTVYMNRGDGTFETRPLLLGFGSYWQITTDDLNGDGLGDLALPNTTDRRIDVVLGKGDGSFGSPISYLSGINAQGIVAVQLNGDTALDLVVADWTTGKLTVLLNNGDGTFRSPGMYPAGSGTSTTPYWLSRADVDRDGKMDIVSANYGESQVVFLSGNGDGTLKPSRPIGSAMAPVGLDVSDLNFDSIADIAVVGDSEQLGRIYHGKGDGTFSAGPTLMFAVPSGTGVRIGDLNGDAVPDIVALCTSNANARVFIGKGDGTFLPEKLFPTVGKNPMAAAIADFNMDGLSDLAISEGNDGKISVLINTTKP